MSDLKPMREAWPIMSMSGIDMLADVKCAQVCHNRCGKDYDWS